MQLPSHKAVPLFQATQLWVKVNASPVYMYSFSRFLKIIPTWCICPQDSWQQCFGGVCYLRSFSGRNTNLVPSVKLSWGNHDGRHTCEAGLCFVSIGHCTSDCNRGWFLLVSREKESLCFCCSRYEWFSTHGGAITHRITGGTRCRSLHTNTKATLQWKQILVCIFGVCEIAVSVTVQSENIPRKKNGYLLSGKIEILVGDRAALCGWPFSKKNFAQSMRFQESCHFMQEFGALTPVTLWCGFSFPKQRFPRPSIVEVSSGGMQCGDLQAWPGWYWRKITGRWQSWMQFLSGPSCVIPCRNYGCDDRRPRFNFVCQENIIGNKHLDHKMFCLFGRSLKRRQIRALMKRLNHNKFWAWSCLQCVIFLNENRVVHRDLYFIPHYSVKVMFVPLYELRL